MSVCHVESQGLRSGLYMGEGSLGPTGPHWICLSRIQFYHSTCQHLEVFCPKKDPSRGWHCLPELYKQVRPKVPARHAIQFLLLGRACCPNCQLLQGQPPCREPFPSSTLLGQPCSMLDGGEYLSSVSGHELEQLEGLGSPKFLSLTVPKVTNITLRNP